MGSPTTAGITLDELYMQRALELAQLGRGYVTPNPMVGAVVVAGDSTSGDAPSPAHQIIGQGFHGEFGGPHAEVLAIRSVRNPFLLPHATLYVTLEPCCHHGKTPPCTDLIISSRIKRVVYACEDPIHHSGESGAQKLRDAGIDVSCGVLEYPARFLNRRFITFHREHRPYIILKWAESADGFIAPKERKEYWISSAPARTLVHEWRTEEMAIMVGYRTALIDNPALTVRLSAGRNPVRITVDRDLTLPKSHQIFDRTAKTFIANSTREERVNNIHYIKVPLNEDSFLPLMRRLYDEQILSVMIEGGSATLGMLIKEGLWDEARIFTSPTKLHEGLPAPTIRGERATIRTVGVDSLETVFNPHTLNTIGVDSNEPITLAQNAR